MPSKRERLFNELGLADHEPTLNPFNELGIDPAFATDLLRADSTGKDIRLLAHNMYRTLSRLYHPDSGEHPDRDRFERLKEADKLIADSDSARFSRWAKTERTASSGREARVKQQAQDLLERSSEALERTMRLGHHALHYTEMAWSQGLLAQRGNMLLLLREDEQNGGLRVHRGHTVSQNSLLPRDEGDTSHPLAVPQAMGIQRFLRENDSFGIAPGSRIGLYMDEVGRASILEPDLAFIMDVTAPIANLREEHDGRTIKSKERIDDEAEEWAQPAVAALHMTTVPSKKSKAYASVQTTAFPTNRRGFETWHLPHEVVGHVGNPEFKTRIRKHRQTGAQAIASAARSATGATYFNLNAVSTEMLITEDAQYSPLLVTGKDLLLFDPQHNMPVLTDLGIVGLIGSHAASSGNHS